MLGGNGQEGSGEEVEWSSDGAAVRLLRDGVCVYEASGDDLFTFVREQARMAASDLPRTARLRIVGNGVVPDTAELALIDLVGELSLHHQGR